MRKVTMLAVLAAVVAAGCGGGGGGAGVSNFLGTWGYSAGTITQACAGFDPTVTDLSLDVVTITRTNVGGADILYTTSFEADGCARYLDVVGNTATLTSKSDCSDRASDASGPYTLLISPFSEGLTYRGGALMTESATNTLRYTYDDGFVLNCTATISNASLYR